MENTITIIFICGSIEPGRDGVGDYSRRLASELIFKGHRAAIIALNDHYVSAITQGTQYSDGIEIPVSRLPSAYSAQKRFQQAQIWINEFAPQWLSLQFVPFAFHSKGLPFGVAKLLDSVGKGKKWHIMVHELWVGMDREASMKFVYWGWLQRQLIKSLFATLKPLVTHTQSNLYRCMLEKIGLKSNYLPLFGNIPVASGKTTFNDLAKNGDNRGRLISFVIFGGIHPGAPIIQFAEELKIYSKATGTKVVLKMLGRCGEEQLYWERAWQDAGLTVEILGEQSPETISAVLSSADFGLSTTPDLLIEKSGSVAAMREHGLPILSISRSWIPRGRGIREMELPSGITKYKQGEVEQFISGNQHLNFTNTISKIADQFIQNLLSPV
jgi:hypothetical protein